MTRAIFFARLTAASLRRVWRVRRRYPLFISSWLAWPALFAVGQVFIARTMAGPDRQHIDGFVRAAGTADYTAFIGVGLMAWFAMNMILWNFGLALRNEQQGGTLEALWMTPVPRSVLLASRGLAELVFALLAFAVPLIEFRLLFGLKLHGSPWLLLLVIVATLPALYGLGLTFASLVLWVKEANSAVFLTRGVFTLFAGLTYPLSVLPEWMRAAAAVLPLTYAVEGIRAVALRGVGAAELWPVLLPLLGLGVLLLLTGQAAFVWSERRVRRMGTLGAF